MELKSLDEIIKIYNENIAFTSTLIDIYKERLNKGE